MMIRWEEDHHCICLFSCDGLQTNGHRKSSTAVSWLDDSVPVVHIRQLTFMVTLMHPGKGKKCTLVVENGSNSFARVREEGFAPKEIAELFRPRLTGDQVGQCV